MKDAATINTIRDAATDARMDAVLMNPNRETVNKLSRNDVEKSAAAIMAGTVASCRKRASWELGSLGYAAASSALTKK
jgi:hypothetical protein